MNPTTAARLLPRQPLSRCLHSQGPSLRNVAQRRLASRGPERLPRTRAEADALIGRSNSRDPRILDEVSVHRAEAMRRAYYIRRRNWLALGAALSMIAPMFLVRLWDLPEPKKAEEDAEGEVQEKNDSLQFIRPTKLDSPRLAAKEFDGKKVVIAAGDKVIATENEDGNPSVTDKDAVELVETGTSYVPYFPKTISLSTSSTSTGPEAISSSAEYTLLGLGIRKVSFLRVQVYVVGLYVKTADLSILQNHLINTVNPTASALIPGEKESLRSSLLDGDKSEEIWANILSKTGAEAVDMAFRIVPVRGTDFKHLQDALMRGIASRTDEVRRKQAELLKQQAAEQGRIALPAPVQEAEFGDETFGLAMREFKALFQGRGKAAKGSVLTLTRDKQGAFGALYEPLVKTNKGEKLGPYTKLGEVKDERVSRLVWLLYLGGKNVSSEDARKSIVDGCMGIVERPVGTVEGMVQ